MFFGYLINLKIYSLIEVIQMMSGILIDKEIASELFKRGEISFGTYKGRHNFMEGTR